MKRNVIRKIFKNGLLLIICGTCAFYGSFFGTTWVEVHKDLSPRAVDRYYGTSLHTLDFYSQLVPSKFIMNDQLEERMKEILGSRYSKMDEDRFTKFAMQLAINEMNDLLPADMENWKAYNDYDSEFDYKYDQFTTHVEASNDEYMDLKEIDNTYYVQFNTFSSEESYIDLKDHVNEINKYDNLVLDLRNNGGGHIDILNEVASLFLAEDEIIYYLGTINNSEPCYSGTRKEIGSKKIIILQGERTASCSEMLISSLSGLNIKKIGQTTYGKGCGTSSENPVSYTNIEDADIAYDSIVELTSARFLSLYWLDKNKKSILNKGIEPDILFSGSDEELFVLIDRTFKEMDEKND